VLRLTSYFCTVDIESRTDIVSRSWKGGRPLSNFNKITRLRHGSRGQPPRDWRARACAMLGLLHPPGSLARFQVPGSHSLLDWDLPAHGPQRDVPMGLWVVVTLAGFNESGDSATNGPSQIPNVRGQEEKENVRACFHATSHLNYAFAPCTSNPIQFPCRRGALLPLIGFCRSGAVHFRLTFCRRLQLHGLQPAHRVCLSLVDSLNRHLFRHSVRFQIGSLPLMLKNPRIHNCARKRQS